MPLIVSAVRTPIGAFNGTLAGLPAVDLGAMAVAEAVRRSGLAASEVEELILGNVLQAGEGQAPARQAALKGGLSKSVRTMTINKVCGSGLQAVMLAARAIRSGEASITIAGGMESMSNSPYLIAKGRTGYRMGHGVLIDSMIKDGLWDPYDDFHMGEAAERCADSMKITREAQDEFAEESYRRALSAIESGAFREEIFPVKTGGKNSGAGLMEEDESPRKANLKQLKNLKPAFRPAGTVTAGNASSLSDGAAALVLTTEAVAKKQGVVPLGRIVDYASFAAEPVWFTTAPAYAIRLLLEKTGLKISEIDLFEINEAFSASSIAVNLLLELDPDRVNVRGGAVALGHPIGASGARILVTLLYALKALNKKRGIASLCIGGGEAVAVLVERTA
ncbi:MAG TPA: thiolase family protein [Nitrospiria bacterium]|nr:thiolase family protein [Nitrospiria bacterium]